MAYTIDTNGDIVINGSNLWYTLDMKDIPQFEGLYAITKNGEIWAYPRSRKHKSKKGMNFNVLYDGKWLKPKQNKDGYLYIILYKNKKAITRKIHRFVALTYIPNPLNKKEVNHINGNKHDNNVNNLEWNTRQENATHAGKNHFFPSGEQHHNAKLSDIDVKKIKELFYTKKYSQRELGNKFGVRQSHISRLITGLRRNTYGL